MDVEIDGLRHSVDIGFLVFNHRTYPRLTHLFEQLGVDTAPSQMSFSVQSAALGWAWCGSSLASVFARAANLASPRFWRLLVEILRFNRLATAAVADAGGETIAAWRTGTVSATRCAKGISTSRRWASACRSSIRVSFARR